MEKEISAMFDKAEELDWEITKECDNVYIFSKISPAGQDFNISIDTDDDAGCFVENIYSAFINFDCSAEAYIWLDNDGHGKNGAPYNMKDLYEDMEACEASILLLHDKLAAMA